MDASVNKSNMLEYIEKNNLNGVTPKYAIIWLHGLGADYNDFLPVVKQLKLKVAVKFVFPNAPHRAITVNNGHVMRAWYDIRDLNQIDKMIDFDGIHASVLQIETLIDKLIVEGFSAKRIIIAGFSQGGVISYYTLLNTKHRLGGIIALSCYLPNNEINQDTINLHTAILACHGKQDLVIPYDAGLNAYNLLRNKGFHISWLHYSEMGHAVCLEELSDITMWINDQFI